VHTNKLINVLIQKSTFDVLFCAATALYYYSEAVCGISTSSLRTSEAAAAAAAVEAISQQGTTTAAVAATEAVAMVDVPCRIGTPSQATYMKVLQALIGAGRSSDAVAVAERAQTMPWYAAQGAQLRLLVQQLQPVTPTAETAAAVTATPAAAT
jgi:hypothetical protein